MNILVIKLNHLGDTLLLTPTIHFLRARFPDARIDVIVRKGCEVVLEGNPDINSVFVTASPEHKRRSGADSVSDFFTIFSNVFMKGYDFAFDLSESDRAKLWLLLSRAKHRCVNDAYGTLGGKKWLVNCVSDYKWASEHQVQKDFHTVLDCMELTGRAGQLRFYPQVDDSTIAKKLPFIIGGGDFVVLHPASRWAFKQWMPERWAEIADIIRRDHGLTVVLSCGPEQREIDLVSEIRHHAKEEYFSTDGSITLHELGWLLGRARLFLGVDTVVMHLAAAMQTPIVALFGPSSEWSWRPWQCDHELVLGDCECKRTRKFICDKTKTYPCMEKIQVKHVIDATRRLLAQRKSIS